MLEMNDFSKKLKLLRKKNLLSLSEMAMLINLKSKGSLSTLENAKNPPSYETLVNIANLFAVKIDWLAGRTDEVLDEAIIIKLETPILEIKLADNTTFRDIALDIYLDSNLRKLNFSLVNRADLIFLLQFIKTVTEKHPKLLHRSIDTVFMQSVEKREFNGKIFSKKPENLYLELLHFIAIIFNKATSASTASL